MVAAFVSKFALTSAGAGGTGHAIDRQHHLMLARRVSGGGQCGSQQCRGCGRVKDNIGRLGAKVDAGLAHPRLGQKNLFGPRHARGAAHPIQIKALSVFHS
jgi:hypothetical protein